MSATAPSGLVIRIPLARNPFTELQQHIQALTIINKELADKIEALAHQIQLKHEALNNSTAIMGRLFQDYNALKSQCENKDVRIRNLEQQNQVLLQGYNKALQERNRAMALLQARLVGIMPSGR